jgi:hypothetical protein
MKKATILLAASMVLISTLACTITPTIPDLDIDVPTIEVGEIQEERQSVPLAGAESADVDIIFGAGQLQLEAGVSDKLLSGYFRYNVDRWAPEIAREGDHLTVRQGGDEGKWGIPSGNVRNRWELEFSPQVPLDVNIRAGAGEGELDFTDLQVSDLDVDLGAGNFVLRFDEPNPVAMDQFTLDTGASKIQVLGAGNASPETMRLQGGVGDISVDLTGNWSRSAEITIRAGAGALTLRLPDDVGVEVETRGGLANIEAYGLRQMGSTYTNDAFGETEIELVINVVTGIGNVRLIEEGARE